MAISLGTAASRLSANAAAIATAIAPTTTAEVQGLASVIQALAIRPDLARQLLPIAFSSQVSPTNPNVPLGTNQITAGLTVSAPAAPIVVDANVFLPEGWQNTLRSRLQGAASSPFRVAMVGDSLTQGAYASNIENASFKGIIRQQLQSKYGDGGTGWKCVVDSLGTNCMNSTWGNQVPAADRIVLTGTWTTPLTTTDGPGARIITGASPNATASRTVSGTEIEVLVCQGNSTNYGTYSIVIDGVEVLTDRVTQVGAFGIDRQVFNVADGSHTVVVRCGPSASTTTNRVFLMGIGGRRLTGVVVDGMGSPSFPATAFNNSFSPGASWTTSQATWGGSSNGSFGPAGIWSGGRARNADLVIYSMGLNDCHLASAVTPASFESNVRAYLNGVFTGVGANLNTQVMIVMQHRGADGWETVAGYYDQYVTRMRALCEQQGHAFVDLWSKGDRSYTWMTSRGYMGQAAVAGAAGTDQVHLSDLGHAWAASQMLAVIDP